MDSGRYVHGPFVGAFESAFARYCGVVGAVGVANGYDAIVLALRGLGVGKGDEVVVSGHTFIATWLAILQVGARPVPVDANARSMLIDETLIARAITPKTKAAIAVPLYGNPVDVDALRAAMGGRSIPVIEDAAQAHGATLRGRKVGSLGDAATFSFYPGKNLGAFGDGGAVVSNDAALIGNVRRWGNYGSTVKYHHDDIGSNSRLDELQAAFLGVKLTVLDEWMARRQAVAELYGEHLNGISGLTLPYVAKESRHAWHLYVVRHAARDRLMQELTARGVETLIHYPIAPHRSKALQEMFAGVSLPVTEEICRTCLSLPMGPHLTLSDAKTVAETVKAAIHALR